MPLNASMNGQTSPVMNLGQANSLPATSTPGHPPTPDIIPTSQPLQPLPPQPIASLPAALPPLPGSTPSSLPSLPAPTPPAVLPGPPGPTLSTTTLPAPPGPTIDASSNLSPSAASLQRPPASISSVASMPSAAASSFIPASSAPTPSLPMANTLPPQAAASIPIGLARLPPGIVTSSMPGVPQPHMAPGLQMPPNGLPPLPGPGQTVLAQTPQGLTSVAHAPQIGNPVMQMGNPQLPPGGILPPGMHPTSLPNLPALPPMQALPSLPGHPGLPQLPGLPMHPGQQQTQVIGQRPETKMNEVYRYNSIRPLFAAAWSVRRGERFRLAVSSLVERDQGNKVTVIQLDEHSGQFIERAHIGHEFPPNCIRFIPDLDGTYPDLVATSCDALRIHKIFPEGIHRPNEEIVLTSNKSAQYSAPLTSFDWNEVDVHLIGTASIDTTCTIFDIEYARPVSYVPPLSGIAYNVKTQLIAHDKPVHDIAFSKVNHGRDHFATVGADGSARMFDLRNLEHSTIVYEDPQKSPLMHIAWNKHEQYQLSTFAQDSTEVVIIDIRMPCSPLTKLKNHNGAVNGIAWAPHSANHICTAGDDGQALIWDLGNVARAEDPILAYSADGEVCQVHWGAAHKNWICIVFNKSLEILRV